jgi:membrane protein implicated in regulation of membrane protease activity
MDITGTQLGLALLIIGVLMLLAEVSAPGSFILVPATVLIVLGGIGLVAPGILLQWYSPIIALIIAVPMTYVSIRLYQKLAPPAPPETTVATSLVGMKGVVVTETRPDTLKGKVRIEHDTWSATSAKPIPAGTQVIVVASEGVHVTVEEIKESKS